VYGGGGIYPDVVLDAEDGAPVWLARLGEEEVITRWMNAWLAAHPDGLGTVEAFAASPVLPAGALADFRAFAQRNGLPVPAGAEVDARLQHELVPLLAGTRWGAAGYYRLSAVLDPQVRQGVAQFRAPRRSWPGSKPPSYPRPRRPSAPGRRISPPSIISRRK